MHKILTKSRHTRTLVVYILASLSFDMSKICKPQSVDQKEGWEGKEGDEIEAARNDRCKNRMLRTLSPRKVIEEAFALISSKVDLDKLEQDLVVTEHFRSIKSGLMKRIKSVGIKARLHDALYLVFNRIFVSECSWSGIGRSGPKIEFWKYVHVLKLFKEISGSRDYSEVEKFFSTKLRNAGTAAKRTGVVKSVSRGQYSKKKKCNIQKNYILNST